MVTFCELEAPCDDPSKGSDPLRLILALLDYGDDPESNEYPLGDGSPKRNLWAVGGVGKMYQPKNRVQNFLVEGGQGVGNFLGWIYNLG